MKAYKMLMLGAAVAASSLMAGTAMAATNAKQPVSCADFNATNATLTAQLAQADSDAARRGIIGTALNGNPNNSECLMNLVLGQNPQQGQPTFSNLIAVLSTDPTNDPLIAKLTQEYGDLIANIQPAGGDETGTPDFGISGGTNEGLENPNQLSQNRAQ